MKLTFFSFSGISKWVDETDAIDTMYVVVVEAFIC